MASIPDKMFFRIGEVSRITGVKSYVLRYWETEFKFLKPMKNKTGQRVYRKKDVELLLQIKKLLYDEKFTIAGAKLRIEDSRRSAGEEIAPDEPSMAGVLGRVYGELSAMYEQLSKPVGA
jgi:DNA-binding transcriptional MerR regulator